MTNATTPVEAAFETQYQSIKQGQKLFEQGLDLQQNATETFLRNGLAAQRGAQRQGTELARELFDAQVDAFESALDEDDYDVRATVDQQFEEFNETQNDTWDEFEDDFVEAFKDLSNQQKALVAKSVGAFLDAQQETGQRIVESVHQGEAVAETI